MFLIFPVLTPWQREVGHGTPSHHWLCVFSSCNRENYKTWKLAMFTGVLITHPADEGWGVPATDWASHVRQWPQQAVTWRLQEGQTGSVAPLRAYTLLGTISSTRQFKFSGTKGSESPPEELQWPDSSGSATALLVCALLLSPSLPKLSGVGPLSASLPHFYWLFRARKFLGRHLKMVFAGWCK